MLLGHAKTGNLYSIDFQRDFNQEWDADSIGVNTFIPWSFMDQKTPEDIAWEFMDQKSFADNNARMSEVFVLKREFTNVLADNPVRSTELTEMTFDWDRLEVPPPGTVIYYFLKFIQRRKFFFRNYLGTI